MRKLPWGLLGLMVSPAMAAAPLDRLTLPKGSRTANCISWP